MHGGDIYGYIRRMGQEPLDFSASVNPYGMHPAVLGAACEALSGARVYPDSDCLDLREAIAQKHGTDPAEILCGAGASDLIYRFVCAKRPGRALIITPAFSEYGRALLLYGCEVVHYPLSCDFNLDEGILDALDESFDLLIINSPHNPSGRVFDRSILTGLAKRCRELGIFILSDECFSDFLEEGDRFSLSAFPGVLSLFAFTKYYGMAGLRLGYCISGDRELLHHMKEAGPPWGVSSVAQAAGVAALGLSTGSYRAEVQREREYLYSALVGLGMRVIPGQVNFLLFYTDDFGLYDKLCERGILIRDCSDFSGLSPGWYRIAVRGHADNARLIEAMEDVS